jgi:hypothetical protein
VRVTELIGFLVVDPMCRNPEDWPSLKCQGPTNGEEILKAEWNLVRSVRVQAMVTHTDTKTCSDPDKESRHPGPMPVEHEKRGDGTNMQKYQCDCSRPV